MKRCPKCEFIYEDDQNCCDMDGIDLVFDPRPLGVTQALETRPALVRQGQRRVRRTAAFSLVGVVFGVLVLAIGLASFERAVTLTAEPALPDATTPDLPLVKEQVAVRRPVKPLPTLDKPEPRASTATIPKRKAKTPRTPVRHYVARHEPESENTLNSAAVLRSTSSRTPAATSPAATPNQRSTRTVMAQSESAPLMRKAETAHARKDSKFVSIMKKTGRFLTKPFRL